LFLTSRQSWVVSEKEAAEQVAIQKKVYDDDVIVKKQRYEEDSKRKDEEERKRVEVKHEEESKNVDDNESKDEYTNDNVHGDGETARDVRSTHSTASNDPNSGDAQHNESLPKLASSEDSIEAAHLGHDGEAATTVLQPMFETHVDPAVPTGAAAVRVTDNVVDTHPEAKEPEVVEYLSAAEAMRRYQMKRLQEILEAPMQPLPQGATDADESMEASETMDTVLHEEPVMHEVPSVQKQAGACTSVAAGGVSALRRASKPATETSEMIDTVVHEVPLVHEAPSARALAAASANTSATAGVDSHGHALAPATEASEVIGTVVHEEPVMREVPSVQKQAGACTSVAAGGVSADAHALLPMLTVPELCGASSNEMFSAHVQAVADVSGGVGRAARSVSPPMTLMTDTSVHEIALDDDGDDLELDELHRISTPSGTRTVPGSEDSAATTLESFSLANFHDVPSDSKHSADDLSLLKMGESAMCDSSEVDTVIYGVHCHTNNEATSRASGHSKTYPGAKDSKDSMTDFPRIPTPSRARSTSTPTRFASPSAAEQAAVEQWLADHIPPAADISPQRSRAQTFLKALSEQSRQNMPTKAPQFSPDMQADNMKPSVRSALAQGGQPTPIRDAVDSFYGQFTPERAEGVEYDAKFDSGSKEADDRNKRLSGLLDYSTYLSPQRKVKEDSDRKMLLEYEKLLREEKDRKNKSGPEYKGKSEEVKKRSDEIEKKRHDEAEKKALESKKSTRKHSTEFLAAAEIAREKERASILENEKKSRDEIDQFLLYEKAAKARADAELKAQQEQIRKELLELSARDREEAERLMRVEMEKKMKKDAERLERETLAKAAAVKRISLKSEELQRLKEAHAKAELKDEADRKARAEELKNRNDENERNRRAYAEKRDEQLRLSARRESSRFLLQVETAQEAEKKQAMEREQVYKEEVSQRYSYAKASSARVSAELKIQQEAARRELFELEARAKQDADRMAKEEKEKKIKRDSMRIEKNELEKAALAEAQRLKTVEQEKLLLEKAAAERKEVERRARAEEAKVLADAMEANRVLAAEKKLAAEKLAIKRMSVERVTNDLAAREMERLFAIENEKKVKEDIDQFLAYEKAAKAKADADLKFEQEKARKELLEMEARLKQDADRSAKAEMERRLKRDEIELNKAAAAEKMLQAEKLAGKGASIETSAKTDNAKELERLVAMETERKAKEDVKLNLIYGRAAKIISDADLKYEQEKARRELLEEEAKIKEQTDRASKEQSEKKFRRESIRLVKEEVEKALQAEEALKQKAIEQEKVLLEKAVAERKEVERKAKAQETKSLADEAEATRVIEADKKSLEEKQEVRRMSIERIANVETAREMERQFIVENEKKVKDDIDRLLSIEAEKQQKVDSVRKADIEKGKKLQEEKERELHMSSPMGSGKKGSSADDRKGSDDPDRFNRIQSLQRRNDDSVKASIERYDRLKKADSDSKMKIDDKKGKDELTPDKVTRMRWDAEKKSRTPVDRSGVAAEVERKNRIVEEKKKAADLERKAVMASEKLKAELKDKKEREEYEKKVKEETARAYIIEQERKQKIENDRKLNLEIEKKAQQEKRKLLAIEHEKKIKEEQERRAFEDKERRLRLENERKIRDENAQRIKQEHEKSIKEEIDIRASVTKGRKELERKVAAECEKKTRDTDVGALERRGSGSTSSFTTPIKKK
jgi:hypothetical protein